ncbi:MAG: GcrA family cell cycle regulator [Pseudomonadota bacterium]
MSSWTEDRVATLSKLWADGLSASQIAKQLGGVTRNAVIGKVHRLGLSGRAKPSRPKPAKPAAPKATPAAAMSASAKAKPARAEKPAAAKAAKKEAAPATLPVSVEAPLKAKPLKDGSYATILTLTDHMCKWPIGDPTNDEFRFCGRKTDPEEPYCKAHSMVAYQPSRRRNSSGKMISIGPAPTSRKRLR